MGAQAFKRGDRVRVTLEGEITRILDIEPGSEEMELRVESGGRASFVYTDMATVEKVEPPGFKPGDTIRNRASRNTYTLGNDGVLGHQTGKFYTYAQWKNGDVFNSANYERVEVS